MNTDYNQIEGKPRSSPIQISSAPRVNTAKHYYINRPPSPSISSREYNSSDHIVWIVEEDPIINDDDEVDVLVLYICAIIAFFLPIGGLIYLCCFKFSFGWSRSRFGPRKKKAYRILILTTLLGILVDLIICSLISSNTIKLN